MKLSILYVNELIWLATDIKNKCEVIFNETPVPEKGYYIKVSPELHSQISAVLLCAANIKKLVFSPTKRFSREPENIYKQRQDRSKFLQRALKGVELVEILNTKVRNSLEHFDEYLDEDNIRFEKPKNITSPMAAYNMTLSHWEAFQPRVYPIRLYIASEKKFYNMRTCIDIGKIYGEALSIIERLQQLNLCPSEGPGGLMVPLK